MEGESPRLERQKVAMAVVRFRGHPMIRGSHRSTIEVTTDSYLTEEGDCIIGVAASSGCLQLDEGLKNAIRTEGAVVKARILVAEHSFEFEAKGDRRLRLSHPREIVIRRSEFINDRTLAVGAGASARDIPRELVRLLKDPRTVGRLEIEVS